MLKDRLRNSGSWRGVETALGASMPVSPKDQPLSWVMAKDLEPGDEIVMANGKTAVVDEVRADAQTSTVYNFAVDTDHTYFVGEAGLWAHNVCGVQPAEETAAPQEEQERSSAQEQPINERFEYWYLMERGLSSSEAEMVLSDGEGYGLQLLGGGYQFGLETVEGVGSLLDFVVRDLGGSAVNFVSGGAWFEAYRDDLDDFISTTSGIARDANEFAALAFTDFDQFKSDVAQISGIISSYYESQNELVAELRA